MTPCLQALATLPENGSLVFQYPHGGSQPFAILFLGDPAPSFALHRLETHTWYISIHTDKSPYTFFLNKKKMC